MTDPRPALMQWFPKRFAPGDMDSSSGERLLGRTELSPLEILIRETAQNSWDAAIEGGRPAYGLSLRSLDSTTRDTLRDLLIGPGRPDVDSTLYDRAVEIFDRGTCGLDGPVTLDWASDDVPRNYQDLILKLGVPRDDGKGGGTYGFGKTAAYAYSAIGTLVFWTRCVNADGLIEDRLIASAFRDAYAQDGVQYTGRHWWGRVEGEMILPLVGEDARSLGARLFERGFGAEETGTSILILAPLVAGAPADDEGAEALSPERAFETSARSAIRRHLWPKLIGAPGAGSSPMEIQLRVATRDIPLIDERPGALQMWGAALNAIRGARQEPQVTMHTPDLLPIDVIPIVRHGSQLGHVAIVRRIQALGSQIPNDDLDPASSSGPGRIALMRGQTELIVSNEEWVTATELEGVDWFAVYKSADDFDAAYARTEPPAHDAWVPSAAGEDGLIIKHTKRRIISAIEGELRPVVAAERGEALTLRTSQLSKRFRMMMPTRVENDERAPERTGPGRRRATGRGALVSVDAQPPRFLGTFDDGGQRQILDFVVRGEGTRAAIRVDVHAIGDDGAREPVPAGRLDAVWHGAESWDQSGATVPVGVSVALEFTGVPRRALRVELDAEAIA
ncbi:hypothetical protein [Homoserinibacter sp. YIM 151385]|uniref:hypothetical protein n=1 Tax=Homoserinibacter sp. YIM 151385 TaxID=2985506 RepID=UPI0022F03D78|nr:hypothetical protein [Homoserinibacter sp. YIM 151385]WBU38029.1 hypothetical protein OF852_00130 [Homoserinibacter sp. YIM 151385]